MKIRNNIYFKIYYSILLNVSIFLSIDTNGSTLKDRCYIEVKEDEAIGVSIAYRWPTLHKHLYKDDDENEYFLWVNNGKGLLKKSAYAINKNKKVKEFQWEISLDSISKDITQACVIIELLDKYDMPVKNHAAKRLQSPNISWAINFNSDTKSRDPTLTFDGKKIKFKDIDFFKLRAKIIIYEFDPNIHEEYKYVSYSKEFAFSTK